MLYCAWLWLEKKATTWRWNFAVGKSVLSHNLSTYPPDWSNRVEIWNEYITLAVYKDNTATRYLPQILTSDLYFQPDIYVDLAY